jgi:RNA 3'-terminal phosphate cyclase (ATP)
MIELDGSTGEGGGQILRTALTLSMITGQAFRIHNIRANRQPPGLRRQHLAAVRAAAIVSNAQVTHADVGSTELEFTPGTLTGGVYEFDIGTAGSTTLVLQTLLPALLHAPVPSSVSIIGGTHNPKAPPVQFIHRAYCRVLAAMGAHVEVELERFGFYPAGGGVLSAAMWPRPQNPQLRRLELMQRGALRSVHADAYVARIPDHVAHRQLSTVSSTLQWDRENLTAHVLRETEGPGNALLLTIESDNVTEVFSAVGEKRVPAETVAQGATMEAQRYLSSGAAVGEHLGDQLMLPMALAGGGRYTVDHVSQHAITNAEVIAHFLPVRVSFDTGENASVCTIAPRA